MSELDVSLILWHAQSYRLDRRYACMASKHDEADKSRSDTRRISAWTAYSKQDVTSNSG